MLPKRKRSGGPQTDAGKQASSRNALKTGAYSSLIVCLVRVKMTLEP